MLRPADAGFLGSAGVVALDDCSRDTHPGRTYVFADPVDCLVALRPDEAPATLSRIEQHTAAGRCVAGYIAYEAGLALDKPIEPRGAPSIPLIWLGVYDRWRAMDSDDLDLGPGDPPDCIGEPALNVTADEYLGCVERIRSYILAGDVYQVNYTCKLRFRNSGSAPGLFARLRGAHPVGHSAFVNLGAVQIASLSPELFLRRRGDLLLSRPMKGTLRRGRWCEEDDAMAVRLHTDEKCQAENLMIVDLMRNDIGRIALPGGVDVPRLFGVERYPSLFQMTSDVRGRVPASVSTEQALRATFPPGSVTGAPKIRAMEIIRETEREDRGVYCGCIGAFWPGGDLLLNVAIRTIVQTGCECEMGIGGAIVADSSPTDEMAEARLKGRFLMATGPAFDLIETLRHEPDAGYAYLDEHLDRMGRSAAYFGWRFDRSDALAALDAAARSARSAPCARVRLRLNAAGRFRTEWSEIDAAHEGAVDLLLADVPLDPDDVFLYHKTSSRARYDADLRAAREHGCFDVLYLNLQGRLAQGAITNVVLEIGGRLLTPPLGCGLLPGVWRRDLLATGRAIEQELTLEDLALATQVWVGNSVRGAIEVARIVRTRAPGADAEVVWSRR